MFKKMFLSWWTCYSKLHILYLSSHKSYVSQLGLSYLMAVFLQRCQTAGDYVWWQIVCSQWDMVPPLSAVRKLEVCKGNAYPLCSLWNFESHPFVGKFMQLFSLLWLNHWWYRRTWTSSWMHSAVWYYPRSLYCHPEEIFWHACWVGFICPLVAVTVLFVL